MKHYENFPVASLLLPARYRAPVQAIYAFARSADDLADEGELSVAERLHQLEHYRHELDLIGAGQASAHPLFARLAAVIREHDLPLEQFHLLLDAFEQDVVKARYENFAELADYCHRSAQPVGRLLLRLYRQEAPNHLHWSDAICSALQLINFCQDVAIDWRKGRVYLPEEDMRRFQVSEAHIASGDSDDAWRALMRFECERARDLLHSGTQLGRALPGRIGLELRAIIQGGFMVLKKIEALDYDVLAQRPTLTLADWPRIVWRALSP